MKLLERLSCPYCEETRFKTLYIENYNSNHLKNFLSSYYKNDEIISLLKSDVYEIVECNHCEGMFQKYIPDEEFSYYIYEKLISPEESYNKKKNIIKTNYKEYTLDSKIIRNLIKKNNNEIKILEFGCGWGFWAKFMKELNFDVETVEISDSRIDFLNENKIHNYKNLSEINKKFDFIFSNQAMEHISNPLKTLKDLTDKLNEDGFMFHKFPSSFFFKSKLTKNYKPKKDCAHPLEHINILNFESFKKMCEKNNLKQGYISHLSFVDKIKILKNKILFNQIILKK